MPSLQNGEHGIFSAAAPDYLVIGLQTPSHDLKPLPDMHIEALYPAKDFTHAGPRFTVKDVSVGRQRDVYELWVGNLPVTVNEHDEVIARGPLGATPAKFHIQGDGTSYTIYYLPYDQEESSGRAWHLSKQEHGARVAIKFVVEGAAQKWLITRREDA